MLIASAPRAGAALGGRLEVDVLTRPETVALLRRRIPELDDGLADQLAAELGDLPLAAAQAAGYLEPTGLPPADYLHRFRTRRGVCSPRARCLAIRGGWTPPGPCPWNAYAAYSGGGAAAGAGRLPGP